ncbi:hypothetical protein Ciccas_007434 [Cichlidogyrus casuarinus]|uniref:Uncharacterized protein n=1 Tax=Cichlidogyrus casuarinus TaxID=1844966 RepID=A0ABD2Q5H6_9PLAT
MSDSGLSTSPSPGTSLVEERNPILQIRYPNLNIQPTLGPYLLQKRISRKFFDSGDYNMAKAQILQYTTYKLAPHMEEAILYHSTGEMIATPDTVAALKKKANHNSNVNTSNNNSPTPTTSSFIQNCQQPAPTRGSNSSVSTDAVSHS